MRCDFFICHSSRDKDSYVAKLTAILDELGLSYWLDSTEVSWGDRIASSIGIGIEKSKFFMPIITGNFLTSPWTEYEMTQAIQSGATILPVAANDEHLIFEKFTILRDVKMLHWPNLSEAESIKSAILTCIEGYHRPYTDLLRSIDGIRPRNHLKVSRVEFGEGPNVKQIAAKLLLTLPARALLPRPDRYAIKALFQDNQDLLRSNSNCHFPQNIKIFGHAGDKRTKTVAAYLCTDTFYFQDSQVISDGSFELKCKLDRGGISAFVDARDGLPFKEDLYSLGEGFGAIGAITIVAFNEADEVICRSPYTICIRKGIRHPEDIWTSRKTGRPITNSAHGEPISEARFVFQSAQPNGGCSDIFAANFDGSAMRNLTQKGETAYDGFFDDNGDEVIAWADKTTIRYASRATGVIKIMEAYDRSHSRD